MTKIHIVEKKQSDRSNKFVRLILTEEKASWHRLVETASGELEYKMGTGKRKLVTDRTYVSLVRRIAIAAKKHDITHLMIDVDSLLFSQLDQDWCLRSLTENLTLAVYEFNQYKTTHSKDPGVVEIRIQGSFSAKQKKILRDGITTGTYTNKARDMANTPASDMDPSALVAAAKTCAKGTRVSVSHLTTAQVKKEGMGALYAVGKGASDGAKFIKMEYYGLGKPKKSDRSKKRPIVLVGKGITYDTGGLNVKPSGSMHDMHLDMSGGAAIIATICCVAKLGLKKNVVALIPTAENAISETAMRAGDIITAHNGKTIEVVHTDAEGRLVLADGLSYAQKYNPRVVIDVATLTGAALVALGQHASALLTKDDSLQNSLIRAGEESGEFLWPLPLWDVYSAPLKKTRADVANIDPSFSKYGGTIVGAAFLSHFAPKCPWAHIDIAPRMEAAPGDNLTKGATGEPMRMLTKFIEQN